MINKSGLHLIIAELSFNVIPFLCEAVFAVKPGNLILFDCEMKCSKSAFDYVLLRFKITLSLKCEIKRMSLAAYKRAAFVIVL